MHVRSSSSRVTKVWVVLTLTLPPLYIQDKPKSNFAQSCLGTETQPLLHSTSRGNCHMHKGCQCSVHTGQNRGAELHARGKSMHSLAQQQQQQQHNSSDSSIADTAPCAGCYETQTRMPLPAVYQHACTAHQGTAQPKGVDTNTVQHP